MYWELLASKRLTSSNDVIENLARGYVFTGLTGGLSSSARAKSRRYLCFGAVFACPNVQREQNKGNEMEMDNSENDDQLIELRISEEGNEYTLIVTHENAQRAVNDAAFRASLLATALEAQAMQNRNVNQNVFQPIENNDEDITNSGRWTDDSVQLLLAEYAERKILFEDPKRHKALWKAVTEELNAHGYTFSIKQVVSKLDTMKRRYRAIKDKNGKSGNGRTDWTFYPAMDDIFGEKKNANLGEMLDSDEPPPDSPPPSSPSSASEASTSAGPSNKRRNAHVAYLEGLFASMTALRAAEEEKKKAEREERERKRAARHADKQEFRKSLLHLLEQSLQKKKD